VKVLKGASVAVAVTAVWLWMMLNGWGHPILGGMVSMILLVLMVKVVK
jgi:hypothetical protein